MTIRLRVVKVKQLPEKLSVKQGRIFFREVEKCMNVDRPCIVLDCSHVRQLDRSVVHLLLCCLEEAMKRNGDVKLAAIPSGAKAALELSCLFEIFDTTADAVKSFRLPIEAASEALVPGVLAARAEESSGTGLRWSFWHAQSVGGFEKN
jgi:ABC-type transporter Mla MlaB component